MAVATQKPAPRRKKHVVKIGHSTVKRPNSEVTVVTASHGNSGGVTVRGSNGELVKKMGFANVVSVRKFDVVGFCTKYGIKRELISRMTAYAPRTVATWAAGKPVSGAAIQKVTELKRLTAALEQLVEPASIGPWFQTSNEAFEGSTPAHLVERGESDRLWRMIHLLESGQPG